MTSCGADALLKIELIMPTGRYYTDFLVIDTKTGPPNLPPAFFLNANEDLDLGIILLTKQSSFTDPSIEQEVASTLEASPKGGLAKIFALVIKLLLSILHEIRTLRSELLTR